MKLNAILEEVFDIDVNTLDESTPFQEVENWDSMNHIILISRLEEVYEVQFTGDEIAEMTTLGAIKEALRKHNVLEEA